MVLLATCNMITIISYDTTSFWKSLNVFGCRGLIGASSCETNVFLLAVCDCKRLM